jgi:hypothetical protein
MEGFVNLILLSSQNFRMQPEWNLYPPRDGVIRVAPEAEPKVHPQEAEPRQVNDFNVRDLQGATKDSGADPPTVV